MKITVKQLKALIREAAEEAVKMHEEEAGKMEEVKEEAEKEEVKAEGHGMEETYEAALNEAVAKAFRAGYQRGVKAGLTRKR